MANMTPTPPIAPPVPHLLTYHGHTRIDPYYWLRHRHNPAVIAYLEAENAYTDAVLAHTTALQQELYGEMLGRLQESDCSVPVNIGPYSYYTRTEAGQQYPIYCRTSGGVEANETILLDLNLEAAGHAYTHLSSYKISPDHTMLAYALDTTGDEVYTVFIKDLTTGTLLPDRLLNTAYSLEWGNDNQSLFYTTLDHARRPCKLYRHFLGTDSGEDTALYDEPDERYRVHLEKTKDQTYLVLQVISIETAEVYTLAADTPWQHFQLLQPRQPGVRYRVEHRQGLYYILTNDNAPNYQLMTAPVASPGRASWQPLVPHRDTVYIDAIEIFADYLVLYERANGLKALRIVHLDSSETHVVEFPESVYTIVSEDNPDFTSGTLRFTYSSLTTPDTVFEYDMATRTRTVRKQMAVLGGFQAEAYQSEHLFATAADGARIRISLVYKKGFVRDGTHPCLLYGYGAYGFSTQPQFNPHLLSLLDRGFLYAIAHVRGSLDMGRQWYDQGKLLYKHNTFTDFIACARALFADRYTTSDKLVIMGRSAGGLLIGAVLNQAPKLAKVAVAQVPFVDAVTTMLDACLPLTVREYEEWGNPHERVYYDAILSYSPYDNIEAQEYPHLLVTAGLFDARVQYWEPAKWTAKLRAMKTDSNRLLLKTHMDAGHDGASGRYAALRDIAFAYAFILDTLDICNVISPVEAAI